jgi:hypothetical protein
MRDACSRTATPDSQSLDPVCVGGIRTTRFRQASVPRASSPSALVVSHLHEGVMGCLDHREGGRRGLFGLTAACPLRTKSVGGGLVPPGVETEVLQFMVPRSHCACLVPVRPCSARRGGR